MMFTKPARCGVLEVAVMVGLPFLLRRYVEPWDLDAGIACGNCSFDLVEWNFGVSLLSRSRSVRVDIAGWSSW